MYRLPLDPWLGCLLLRDLGRRLQVTQRALAGTLGTRVKEATTQVISVGAHSMRFQRMLGSLLGLFVVVTLHALGVRWHVRSGPKNFP